MQPNSNQQMVGNILLATGVLMGIAGAVLTVVLGELWPLALIVVGISDLVVAMMFRSGRMGSSS